MAKSTGTDVATTEAPALPAAYDYGEDAGAGFEGTKGSDLSVPFLAILQKTSPQVEGGDAPIAGAKVSMLFNTVTREMWPADVEANVEGLAFIPCHKETAYVEWVPRDNGGGFVAMHDPNGQIVKDAIEANDGKTFGKLKIGDNDLVETHYVYGLFLNKEGSETEGFAVISFTSTKITPYKDWITAMFTIKGKPPMFANRAILRTVKQKNDYGTFFNFRIDPFGETWIKGLINPKTETALLVEAKEFREMVVSGMARADFDSQRSAEGAGGSADGGGEKAPF